MTAAPRRIALVGCGKAKAMRPAPARMLYTGAPFRSALNVAVAEFGQDVWILSAKYGLVDPDEELAPYDLSMRNLDDSARWEWGRDVIRNLVDADYGNRVHLTVFAGEDYVDALRVHLPSTWTLDEPMKGIAGQGRRLAPRRAHLLGHRELGGPNPFGAPLGRCPRGAFNDYRRQPSHR